MTGWNGVHLGDLTLNSDRLTLRAWRPDDATVVFEAASSDPWMREFLPIPDPYTRADAAFFVAELGHEGRFEGTGLGGALVESATGRVVGGAGIRLPAQRHGRCHIGYSVYPAGRGNGYAAEAADMLARWAFGIGVRRVELQVSVRNVASLKSALRAGFRYEGIERQQLTARNWIDDGALLARLASDGGRPIDAVLPPLPGGALSDDVLALRMTVREDAPSLVEEHNDAETMRWNLDDKAADPDALTATAAAAGLQWLVGPIGRMTMVDVATDRYAGSMQLRFTGPPEVAEVGYAVHPAFRGRGYTTRGLRLLIPWAFGEARIRRLELGAKVANLASQKAAINAGFQPDGVAVARLRNPDGTFSDEARFAMVRAD